MFDRKTLDDVVEKLTERLPSTAQHLRDDMRKQFRDILQQTFERLDLVTRDEFDIQVKVLARTRAKVEELSQHIEALDSKKKVKKDTQ